MNCKTITSSALASFFAASTHASPMGTEVLFDDFSRDQTVVSCSIPGETSCFPGIHNSGTDSHSGLLWDERSLSINFFLNGFTSQATHSSDGDLSFEQYALQMASFGVGYTSVSGVDLSQFEGFRLDVASLSEGTFTLRFRDINGAMADTAINHGLLTGVAVAVDITGLLVQIDAGQVTGFDFNFTPSAIGFGPDPSENPGGHLDNFTFTSPKAASVPEPSLLVLLGSAFVGSVSWMRKRRTPKFVSGK